MRFVSSSQLIDLNFFKISSLSMKVPSSFIKSKKGKQKEFFIEPLFSPSLGSGISPLNLFLFLASITLNFY